MAGVILVCLWILRPCSLVPLWKLLSAKQLVDPLGWSPRAGAIPVKTGQQLWWAGCNSLNLSILWGIDPTVTSGSCLSMMRYGPCQGRDSLRRLPVSSCGIRSHHPVPQLVVHFASLVILSSCIGSGHPLLLRQLTCMQ